MNSGYGSDDSKGRPHPTLYPEVDQVPNFAWSGFGQSNNHPVPALVSQYHQTSAPSSRKYRLIAPYRAPVVSDQQPVSTGYALKPSLPQRELQTSVPPPRARSKRASPQEEEPDFLKDFDPSDDDDQELSDADSDYRNLQSDIAKFKDSVRKFRSAQRDDSSEDETQFGGIGNHASTQARRRGRPSGSRGRGILRGPRKAAEPTGDIKYRMSKASQAFIEEKYEEAFDIVAEVIRINAETHEAWTLLASIFKENGDLGNTLLALIYAAHLRPKDVDQWLNCARFALEETGDERSKFLPSAKFCFSSAIRANPKDDTEARIGKAAVLRELGRHDSAITEYRRVLKQQPHNMMILQLLAEAYIDQDGVESALALYKESLTFYQESDIHGQGFDWSDVNIYVELHGYLGQYAEGIKQLKFLSRWLLGRGSESYWDEVEDDREWDPEDTRRLEIPNFVPGEFTLQQYGNGLPLELRVKLGLYRLHLGSHEQAISHLMSLDPENQSQNNLVVEFEDLFYESADSLQTAGLYKEALVFYKALQRDDGDASLLLKMGGCYLQIKQNRQAEDCFQTAIQVDDSNVEARILLAKLYEDLDEQEHAFVYINEIMNLRKQTKKQKPRQRKDDSASVENKLFPKSASKSYYKPKRVVDPAERQRQEDSKSERLQEQYNIMRQERDEMRAGNHGASQAWMDAADELVTDFRGFKSFYPWDKYIRFLGYTGKGQQETGAPALDVDIAAMADRISSKLGADINDQAKSHVDIPENYRGISFADWLDIFLDYALCLARYGRRREAYEVCEAAKDANVYYHSRDDMFLIHVCWCTCAVLANDEETCVAVCRYFMKDYQFTSDTYRMYAALTRLCQSPISWYNSGPTQKYMLRQIKAMDYSLLGEGRKQNSLAEKGSYTAQNESGDLIINDDMDVALLMLYGHILYTGTSYSYALNYFFRAHSLDPDNPMINLSIGLGYIHYGLKRQSENRQFQIMQGMSFLFRYYESRRESEHFEERQEAHYNIARAYHLLGLTHLSIPYYLKVLEGARHTSSTIEALALDAAYNLQTIYAMAGNLGMANQVTEAWLVV